MRTLFLLAVLVKALGATAQEPKKGLRLDLGTSAAFVFRAPVEADNWIGSKPHFGASLDAAINWSIPKDYVAIGLGGGLFLWGDRVLYPVFIQLTVAPSS